MTGHKIFCQFCSVLLDDGSPNKATSFALGRIVNDWHDSENICRPHREYSACTSFGIVRRTSSVTPVKPTMVMLNSGSVAVVVALPFCGAWGAAAGASAISTSLLVGGASFAALSAPTVGALSS